VQEPDDGVSFKTEGSQVKIVAYPSVLDRNFGSVKPGKRPEDAVNRRNGVLKEIAEDVVRPADPESQGPEG